MTSSRASAWDFSSRGPLATSHANFICGRPEIFERPLMVNVREEVLAAKLCVGNYGHLALRANLAQSRRLACRTEMPRRIIGMDHNYGASAGRDGAFECRKVD